MKAYLGREFLGPTVKIFEGFFCAFCGFVRGLKFFGGDYTVTMHIGSSQNDNITAIMIFKNPKPWDILVMHVNLTSKKNIIGNSYGFTEGRMMLIC